MSETSDEILRRWLRSNQQEERTTVSQMELYESRLNRVRTAIIQLEAQLRTPTPHETERNVG